MLKILIIWYWLASDDLLQTAYFTSYFYFQWQKIIIIIIINGLFAYYRIKNELQYAYMEIY
jgi:hypothetical protein